jgi:hypothetical protein
MIILITHNRGNISYKHINYNMNKLDITYMFYLLLSVKFL